MKRLAIIIFAVFLTVEMSGQGINFLHDLDKTFEQAKKTKKLVFVDFYTSWCGPCKYLINEVFPNKDLGNFYNKHFISCKVRCDDNGIGEKLMKKYEIFAFPTLIFMDTEGNIVHKTVGAREPNGLIIEAKKALDTDNNLLAYFKKFEAGCRDNEFMYKYFTKLKECRMQEKMKKHFNEFFNTADNEDKISLYMYNLIEKLGIKPFSPIFNFVENNSKEYLKLIPEERLNKFFYKSYFYYLGNIQRNNSEQFKKLIKQFEDKDYSFEDELLAYYDVQECLSDISGNTKKSIHNYCLKGSDFLNKYGSKNPNYTIYLVQEIGNWIWGKDDCITPIKWMKDLLDQQRTEKNLMLYRYILERNCRWDESLKLLNDMKNEYEKKNMDVTKISEEIEKTKKNKLKFS